jgi:Cdc6-like AAA superfamily ATPase
MDVNQHVSVTVIGIANSVELFRGELNNLDTAVISAQTEILQTSGYISKNEKRLLFKPYTAEELGIIVFNLYREHMRDFLKNKRAFQNKTPSMSLEAELSLLQDY